MLFKLTRGLIPIACVSVICCRKRRRSAVISPEICIVSYFLFSSAISCRAERLHTHVHLIDSSSMASYRRNPPSPLPPFISSGNRIGNKVNFMAAVFVSGDRFTCQVSVAVKDLLRIASVVRRRRRRR